MIKSDWSSHSVLPALRRATSTLACVLALSIAGSACGSSEGGVAVDEQDPKCHSQALMIASSNPNFEWNESGMEHYHHAYETCVKYANVIGQ